MRLKIFLPMAAIIVIIAVSIFSFGLKETAIQGIADKNPEYDCKNGICTSCIIEGNVCSCGTDVCDCGNMTVNKSECSIF